MPRWGVDLFGGPADPERAQGSAESMIREGAAAEGRTRALSADTAVRMDLAKLYRDGGLGEW